MENINKLTNTIGGNFVAWADANFKAEKRRLFDDFLNQYPDDRKYCNSHRFNKNIRAYLQYKYDISKTEQSSENTEVTDISLSDAALNTIECLREDNSQGFKNLKETLSLLLVEIVQQNVGDDNWTQFAKALADQIDFINSLQ
ncbi:MAG: hypothetical protein Q8R96_11670 [Bacteroidota bacterium]|nr:hypothetical protein [Bacteroidota bacterium]